MVRMRNLIRIRFQRVVWICLVALIVVCLVLAVRSKVNWNKYGELLYGAAKSEQRVAALERLRELVNLLPALPLPATAGEAYGMIRARLESKGEMIGNNDLWIAAHAVAARLTLVTDNEKEFRRVRGLKIQNWAR